LPAHLVSIIYNQLIANITLLKPLSFSSLIQSIPCSWQWVRQSSLSRPQLTQLTTPFSLLVSFPVSVSWFQVRLCQFHSYRQFLSQYPSSLARSKLLGSSCYSLIYQHPQIHFIGFQFSNKSIF